MFINFKKAKFSCYALGKIMGYDREEKLSKKELLLLEKLEKKEIQLTDEELECRNILRSQKKASESTLSKTAIRCLVEEVFIYHKYGERIRPGGESLNESVTRIMKGTLAELSAIDLLSQYDGINYKKNSKKYRNKWLSGIPDIIHKKRLGDRTVTDVKSSWDLYTFMDNLPKNISLLNKSQVQGYVGLTKADVGQVCHILVSSPDELIEKQVAKLKYKNVFATREELDIAIELTRRSMKFDDIPMEQRIIRFTVPRDEEEQKRMYERVDFCRSWLMQYQLKHEEYFKKD
jgi:hypothetical protein